MNSAVPKLNRPIDVWRSCDPKTMADKQSNAAITFAFEDMRHDILALNGALLAIKAALQDPVTVHAALLRGEIAKPELRSMLHVYGSEVLDRWDVCFAGGSPATDA